MLFPQFEFIFINHADWLLQYLEDISAASRSGDLPGSGLPGQPQVRPTFVALAGTYV
jgi:hypothetical protein